MKAEAAATVKAEPRSGAAKSRPVTGIIVIDDSDTEDHHDATHHAAGADHHNVIAQHASDDSDLEIVDTSFAVKPEPVRAAKRPRTAAAAAAAAAEARRSGAAAAAAPADAAPAPQDADMHGAPDAAPQVDVADFPAPDADSEAFVKPEHGGGNRDDAQAPDVPVPDADPAPIIKPEGGGNNDSDDEDEEDEEAGNGAECPADGDDDFDDFDLDPNAPAAAGTRIKGAPELAPPVAQPLAPCAAVKLPQEQAAQEEYVERALVGLSSLLADLPQATKYCYKKLKPPSMCAVSPAFAPL